MTPPGPKASAPSRTRRPGCLLLLLLGAGLVVALIAGIAGAGSGGRAGRHERTSVAAGAPRLPSSPSSTPSSQVPATLPTTTVTSVPTTTAPEPSATQGGGSGPGSCHARGAGLYVLPDPICTPGATNPHVSQSDIGSTICSAGWTETVRPPESYTEPLKYQQMTEYGDGGSAGGFEEDHLIPLELGGSPTSPLNLWPEPGATPNLKDSVENAANRAVCDGRMTLDQAQQAIVSDWITLGQQLGVTNPSSTPAPGGTTSGPPPAGSVGASCTASASFDDVYDDYDVYVHSGQPDATVTVTASGGARATWHTGSDGYADVYLKTGGPAPGQQVTVSVGSATCSTTLP